MFRKNPWLYVLFGIYPLSIFELGLSNISTIKQVLLLIIITSILISVGYYFNFLNIFKSLIVVLFVITPYVIGKLYGNGVFNT
ncbi:hypothetical protein D3Z33_15730 [Senegalia massiliensis]|uniref:Uncharacterized protein n=1 Tax=Senegalia massiliensis TaxID=1720316 RepID=A0A845R737_9CLOT|nr:hypothetical protein [Senegalia massiliensis]